MDSNRFYDPDAVLRHFRRHAAETDARVRAGIEENRKGSATILFEDAEGRPCETTHVEIRQKTHDFKYGANLFMLGEFPDSADKNALYEELFAGAFNLATLPFYWKGLEPEEGRTRYEKGSTPVYRRPTPDLCLDWCEAHGIEPKAHCLNYVSGAGYPEWLRSDVAREKRLLEKRFAELSERYARRIPTWEVTNETLLWLPHRLCLSEFFTEPDHVEWNFKTAERFFPENRLLINESQDRIWQEYRGTRSAYWLQIENALLKGCRIDGIGMQAHSFWGTDKSNIERMAAIQYDPRLIFDVLDTYALLGRPIQITEITIPAYSDNPADEEVQAEILRELYRIWFSHPAMEAIVYWNIPDGYAAGAEPGDHSHGENVYRGGLCRFDLSPKPAYEVIRDLFVREWRTNLVCDVSGGRLDFRGFCGTYEVMAVSNGRTVSQTFHLARRNPIPMRVSLG